MKHEKRVLWAVSIPMGLLAIATFYPMFYAMNISFMTRQEYVLNRMGLAGGVRVNNFIDAWNQAGMGTYFANSIIVTLSSVALLLLFGSMAGFAMSHLKFRGSSALFLLVLGSLMIPFQVVMVPTIKLLNDIGLLNTHLGLILVYTAQFLPFTTYFLTSYYAAIPDSIPEAARVDGNGTFGIWWRIMLPLGRPALLSMGIMNALFCWNDILISLMVMQTPSKRTVMVGVSALRGQFPDNVPTYMAGVLLAIFPVIIVYLIFQRQITAGITAGSTKG